MGGQDTSYLVGLSDGTYKINYNSTDNVGNVEPTHTATVILDNTPPATNITIGDPKYASTTTYVTPDTPFTLAAADTGSGVKPTAYRITNSSGYNSGWLTHSSQFDLTSLSKGNYAVAFNSTDNLGNVETTHQVSVTLFYWKYVFTDSYGRGTILEINLAYKFFEFIAPGNAYGIRKASYMQVFRTAIIINHSDGQLKLLTTGVDSKLNICIAAAWDKQTGKMYLLVQAPKPNCKPR